MCSCRYRKEDTEEKEIKTELRVDDHGVRRWIGTVMAERYFQSMSMLELLHVQHLQSPSNHHR
jgi:hypothetical protein